MSQPCNSILVIGGTGNTGRNVVKFLEKKSPNTCIKVASRDEKKFKSLGFGKNTKFQKFEFSDPKTWDAALEGVDRVFLMALPLDPHPENNCGRFIDKCKERMVRKICFLSVINAERFPLIKIESMLKNSGMIYCILRPPFFMENLSEGFMKDGIKDGNLVAPVGQHAVSWISTRDIGECAANMLLEDKFNGQILEITGPAPINFTQLCDVLSKQLGRPIKFTDARPDEFHKNCLKGGLPEGSTQYLSDLYLAVRDDKANRVSKSVHQITGHEPMAFETFVSEAFSKTSKPGM
ncbi:hypothetical protein DICPUDRAFT_91927 [Dictyostelium purpureum]|uniref:NmrA-like domain-containing protein n=1 Tax=Dictyostelium purpureum TaxID=5786 RepID=F0ZJC4_DICPU|nr:uncharacterized protein DICPUDRAFT_91927 [Dictyostelium purpureum]EGC35953.1 hypothetical protein DICPUDRAFT_91927 [Dictyostelium purpureum]|eukprot:XP_003287526.1 hypothetical protein DICPUDRAFT_91927 [Dictyostelium purpureum]